MSGHIRRRGEQSWELKYEAGTDLGTGKRASPNINPSRALSARRRSNSCGSWMPLVAATTLARPGNGG